MSVEEAGPPSSARRWTGRCRPKAEHLAKFFELAAVDPTASANQINAGAPGMRKTDVVAVARRL